MTPATRVSAAACWIRPAGVLIDRGTLLANGDGRSAVSLNGCYVFDAAVAMPVVIPVDELGDPLTGLVFVGKWLAGVIRPIFHRADQRFRVRVVVAEARLGERPERLRPVPPDGFPAWPHATLREACG